MNHSSKLGNEKISDEPAPPVPPVIKGVVAGKNDNNGCEFPPPMYANPFVERENGKRVLRPNSPLESPPEATTPKSCHSSPLNCMKLPSYDFKEEQLIEALLSLKQTNINK
mgnify:CR=1 FL=1